MKLIRTISTDVIIGHRDNGADNCPYLHIVIPLWIELEKFGHIIMIRIWYYLDPIGDSPFIWRDCQTKHRNIERGDWWWNA